MICSAADAAGARSAADAAEQDEALSRRRGRATRRRRGARTHGRGRGVTGAGDAGTGLVGRRPFDGFGDPPPPSRAPDRVRAVRRSTDHDAERAPQCTGVPASRGESAAPARQRAAIKEELSGVANSKGQSPTFFDRAAPTGRSTARHASCSRHARARRETTAPAGRHHLRSPRIDPKQPWASRRRAQAGRSRSYPPAPTARTKTWTCSVSANCVRAAPTAAAAVGSSRGFVDHRRREAHTARRVRRAREAREPSIEAREPLLRGDGINAARASKLPADRFRRWASSGCLRRSRWRRTRRKKRVA